MNGSGSYLPDENAREMLQKLIEIFTGRGLLNKELKICCRDKKYRISCNLERFFVYRINENCGLGPGIPGWLVCLIKRDYAYCDFEIRDFTSAGLSIQDWLNIVSERNFKEI